MKKLRLKLNNKLENLMVLMFKKYPYEKKITGYYYTYILRSVNPYAEETDVMFIIINDPDLPNISGIGQLEIGKKIPSYPIKMIQNIIVDFKKLIRR